MPAQQFHRSGTFTLPCSADVAFPLFSPEGERLWIKTWNPQPIFPETIPEKIEFRRDTVFGEGDEFGESLWTILDADPVARRAEYVRHVFNSHAAHIVVQIDSADEGCRVTVTYILTVFGPDAAKFVSSFSESGYAEKMRNWQRWITDYLSSTR
jgi:hypothetical protein